MGAPGVKYMYQWVLCNPDSKFLVANTGPTWVLAAPGGPHVGPMNLDIKEVSAHYLAKKAVVTALNYKYD